jgi:hypothetical protein
MTSINVTLKSGMPGMLQYVGFVANVPPDTKPYTPVQGGTQGAYQVVLVLARPGYSLCEECQLSFGSLEGDSHLAITPPAVNNNADGITFFYDTPEGGKVGLRGLPNKRGYLGRLIAVPVFAKDAQNARLLVTGGSTSVMSSLSLQLDIPMMIYQSEVTELKTGNMFMSIVSPYLEAPVPMAAEATTTPEFRVCASYYREALNSNTPVFQFLCYFKIAESILNRRKCRAKEARKDGQSPSSKAEIVPSESSNFVQWLNEIFVVAPEWDKLKLDSIFLPEVLGRKFTYVIETYLRPLRTKIAHAVLDTGVPAISADDDMHIAEIYKWLPLTKCMVRHMLRHDFPNEFLNPVDPKDFKS